MTHAQNIIDHIPAKVQPLNTCGTCKHWDTKYAPCGTGICGAVLPFYPTLTLCAPAGPLLKAFVTDREGDGATLFTHSTFGCVLHEDK